MDVKAVRSSKSLQMSHKTLTSSFSNLKFTQRNPRSVGKYESIMLHVVTSQKPIVMKTHVLSPLLYQMPMPRNLELRFCLWRRKASAQRCTCDAVRQMRCPWNKVVAASFHARNHVNRLNYNARMHRYERRA